MKSEVRKYILENMNKKSIKEIAKDLGIKEKEIREFLDEWHPDLISRYAIPKSRNGVLQNPFFIGLILFSLLLFFFNDVIFRGKTLKSSATISQVLKGGPYDLRGTRLKYIPYADNTPAVLDEPYLEFKKNTFEEGTFPLWNPHQACGMPFFVAGQSTVLFLLTLLQYFIPEKYSWDILILLEIFLSGIFTFIFMRILNYSVISSIFSAVAYMFSGPIITWMVNVITNTAMFLPLILICIEKIIKLRNIKWMTIGSFVFCLLIISGHPERVFLASFTAFIYFTLRIISLKETRPNKLKILKLTFFATLVGFLLSAIYILPSIEYFIHGWTFQHEQAGHEGEKISQAITIIIPYFFQKVLLTNEYQRQSWWGGYIGIMVMLFALIGIFRKDHNKNNIIFGVIAGFIIFKCYGVWIANWIGYLPIFKKMNYPTHYPQDFAFAMAVVSGIGLQRIIASKRRLIDIMTPTIAITIFIIGYLFYYLNKPNVLSSSIYTFGILLLVIIIVYFINHKRNFSLLLIILLVLELFYLMPKEHANKYDSFSKVPYIEFLKRQKSLERSFGILWTLFPNTATGYGIDDLGIYEGIFVKRFVTYTKEFLDTGQSFRDFNALRIDLPTYHSPFLDLLNIGYIIGPINVEKDEIYQHYKERDLTDTELIYSREVKIFKRNTAFPRAFVAHNVIFAIDQNHAIKLMKENSQGLRNTVIIEGANDPIEKSKFSPARLTDISEVKILKYKSNRVRIKVALPYPGVLVLADTYYPGWKVSVNGKTQKIYIADFLLRGVPLGKGDHIVEFYYKPLSFQLGMWVSLSTCFTLIIFGVCMKIKSKKNDL